MLHQRCSGLLLHPTSLPSRFGIGDFGEGAYQFVDFLAEADQNIWQILPLGPTGFGNSPYLCYSALAINPWLINPDKLVSLGLILPHLLEHAPAFDQPRVDYDAAIAYKSQLFKQVYASFTTRPQPELTALWDEFCQAQASWLEDYALFMAIKEAHHEASWYDWEPGLAQREVHTVCGADPFGILCCAHTRRNAVTCACCSGRASSAVGGMKASALLPHKEATWRC